MGGDTRISIFMTGIRNMFSVHTRTMEDTDFHAVRLKKTYYMLAYTVELIFYTVRGYYISMPGFLFGFSCRTIVYIAHMLASLLVMLLWSDHFRRLVRGSVVLMACGYVPCLFLPDGTLRLCFGILGNIGLGGAVTSSRCGFAFACNNVERILGMVVMFFSVAFIKFGKSQGLEGVFPSKVLPLVLLALLSFCLLEFREEDFDVKESSTKEDARSLYWALAYFIVYFAIDGYLWGLVTSLAKREYSFLFTGMILGGLILFFMLLVLKLNPWHAWNIFFASAITLGVFAVLVPSIGTETPLYFFCGLTSMGWPLCIYMLACIQHRFASYRLLKKSTIVFVLLSPVTTISDNLVEDYFPKAMPMVTLILVLVTVVMLLMLSPFSYRDLFSVGWMKELTQKRDMTIAEEEQGDRDMAGHKDRFAGYDLTPRQKEVARLLLRAKTRRQISGELCVSESTIKTHTSDLYHKLGINSRVELFRRFGVDEDDHPEEG